MSKNCKCGYKISGCNTITICETHISITIECPNCNRRIHSSYNLSTETTFISVGDGVEIEEVTYID